MKTLILIRHASTEGHGERGDRSRKLTGAGLAEARAQGELLSALGVEPGALLHSPAVRTTETAAHLVDAAGWTLESEPKEAIYEASAARLVELIRGLDDDHATVVVVGHQPGVGEVVGYLLGGARLNVSAGCAIGLAFAVDQWCEVDRASGWLLWMMPAGLATTFWSGQ